MTTTAQNPFLAQIPPDAFESIKTDPMTNIFYWFGTLDVDGVPFRYMVTANENMWSGRGDKTDPLNRLGSNFSFHCEEKGGREDICESEFKDRRLHNIHRRKGQRHFQMRHISGQGKTLQEAKDKFVEYCRWFLHSKS